MHLGTCPLASLPLPQKNFPCFTPEWEETSRSKAELVNLQNCNGEVELPVGLKQRSCWLHSYTKRIKLFKWLSFRVACYAAFSQQWLTEATVYFKTYPTATWFNLYSLYLSTYFCLLCIKAGLFFFFWSYFRTRTWNNASMVGTQWILLSGWINELTKFLVPIPDGFRGWLFLLIFHKTFSLCSLCTMKSGSKFLLERILLKWYKENASLQGSLEFYFNCN